MKVEPNGRAVLIQAAGTIGTGVGKSLTVSLYVGFFMKMAVELLP
jgi:hypothetical protein